MAGFRAAREPVANRVFVVTGCASGIGRELADAIVAAGARLVATDRDIEALQRHETQQGWPQDRTMTRALDVTESEQWTRAIEATRERFGRVDVLVNVAGYLLPGWVNEVDDAAVHRHFDVNLKGVVFGTRAVSNAMLEQGSGHIVNVASLAALAPIPGLSLYSASKYAVRAFSLAAAQELRPKGVAVTVVCPDAVRTPMLELQRDYEQAAMTFSGPRVLEPAEVTGAILGPVLARAPLEVFLPPSRGWLARVADVFPTTALTIGPFLRKRGRTRQQGD
jgi:3-oxoacyl-[acyl-carrier protein] reductase